MEDWPGAAKGEWNGRITDRGPVQVEKLRIPPDYPVLVWEVVDTSPKVPRAAEVADDLRASEIALESPRNHHRGKLQLVSAVGVRTQDRCSGALEIAQLVQVKL